MDLRTVGFVRVLELGAYGGEFTLEALDVRGRRVVGILMGGHGEDRHRYS